MFRSWRSPSDSCLITEVFRDDLDLDTRRSIQVRMTAEMWELAGDSKSVLLQSQHTKADRALVGAMNDERSQNGLPLLARVDDHPFGPTNLAAPVSDRRISLSGELSWASEPKQAKLSPLLTSTGGIKTTKAALWEDSVMATIFAYNAGLTSKETTIKLITDS